MITTFRDLDRDDQIKAINNVISQHGVDQLAYLIQVNDIAIYGWFSFEESKEGSEYWLNLLNK
jgi:hypothetical protein